MGESSEKSQPIAMVAKSAGAAPAKRTMSVSARRKIAAAQKARWAKIRAQEKKAAQKISESLLRNLTRGYGFACEVSKRLVRMFDGNRVRGVVDEPKPASFM